MDILEIMKIPYYKNGSGIHIKEKNRGKFTKSAKEHGMEVLEFANHVLNNKDKYNTTLVKRANFAKNAKTWKHAKGGLIKKCQEGEILDNLQIYTAGYTDPITITANKKLTKRLQMQADKEWREYLKQHPIQIGSEEYNRLPEKAKAQVYKNSVTNAIDKAALPTAAAIIAPTVLSAIGANAIPFIEGVTADWSILSPILKEAGKRMLASELGYQTVSLAYKLGSNGRDLLYDTGNTLFPYIENQTVKDIFSAAANPGGWVGIPGQAIVNSFKEVAKPVVTRMITGDAYTTLGGKFGYYGNTLKERAINTMKRRLGLKTDPSHPEFLRKIDTEYLTTNKNGDIDILAGQRPNRDFINFSTDRHVVSHSSGEWDYMPGLIINPEEFKSFTPISIEPSDTFFRKPNKMTANPKNVTLVSGNIEELNKARSLGMETLSSKKLRELYKKMAENGKPHRRSNYRRLYTDEIQKLTNKRGNPDINDYKYIESLYGLKSGVVPIEDVNISELINLYKKGLLIKYPNNSLLGRKDPEYILKRKYNKVFYDPASSVESDYSKKISVPQLYSDLSILGFKQGRYVTLKK